MLIIGGNEEEPTDNHRAANHRVNISSTVASIFFINSFSTRSIIFFSYISSCLSLNLFKYFSLISSLCFMYAYICGEISLLIYFIFLFSFTISFFRYGNFLFLGITYKLYVDFIILIFNQNNKTLFLFHSLYIYLYLSYYH